MTTRNPITGDLIKTKGSNDSYRSGWDAIFGKKTEAVTEPYTSEELVEHEEAFDLLNYVPSIEDRAMGSGLRLYTKKKIK